MLTCFIAKTGGGKTLTMMHFLVRDLIETERFIVTNIPVKLDELADYLHRECDGKRKMRVPDLNKRLLILSTAETLYFWRYRAGGLVLPKWDGKDPNGKLISEEDLLIESEKYWKQIYDKEKTSTPISYYISEAHRYYNAKRFQRVSVIAELYITHHRHLHDEVFFDTQYPGQLAVILRELIHEWHELRNDYNRTVGILLLTPKIKMKSYFDIPSSGSKHFGSRVIKIEENGVAGCYSTTGALGGIERGTETKKEKKKKGIPIRWFMVIVSILIIVFAKLIFSVPGYFARSMMGGLEAPIEEKEPQELSQFMQDNLLMSVSSQGTKTEQAPAVAPVDPFQNMATVRMTSFQGAITSDGLWLRAELTNGELVTEHSPELTDVIIEDSVIVYKGHTFVLFKGSI